MKFSRKIRIILMMAVVLAVGGCGLAHAPTLDPHGPVALTERNLLFAVSALVLIVIVPVFVLTFWFAWQYRASNTNSRYLPEWSYSARLDALTWLAPALIVTVIGYLVWSYTHSLDPYRLIAGTSAPLEVEVVAEDWKWLFIYPEQNIASVNQLVFPSGRPLRLKLTSGTVMNSFYIAGLGGQIFTMPKMQTELNLLATHPAEFVGRNTQFSGRGFADQQFAAKAVTSSQFDAWVSQVRQSPASLDAAAYAELTKPSSNVPPTFYSSVAPKLFAHIIEQHAGMPAPTGAH